MDQHLGFDEAKRSALILKFGECSDRLRRSLIREKGYSAASFGLEDSFIATGLIVPEHRGPPSLDEYPSSDEDDMGSDGSLPPPYSAISFTDAIRSPPESIE